MFPDTVETLRLHLRRPVTTDAERIFQTYAQDREVTRYVEWIPHTSVETTKKFIAVCQDRWTNSVAFPYVITRKEDGELLGMIEVRPKGHRANFGYVLARSYWGNGFMPEAIAAIVKITLRTLRFIEWRRLVMSRTRLLRVRWRNQGSSAKVFYEGT